MRIDQGDAEDLLRSTLRGKAQEAHATLTLDDVKRGVSARRRHTGRRTTLLVAAAVLVAVGVPAVLLHSGGGRPSPAPAPTPTPTPTPAGLAAIPRGADPRVSYLHDGRVHEPDGTTVRLPGRDDPTQFTPYHGGWLTVSDTGTLTEWDSSGSTVLVMEGESQLAVSADQLSTAYSVPGEIHVGLTTGMGETEATYSVGTSQLVGFVRDSKSYDDVVFTGGDGGQVGYIDRGARHVVGGLSQADATSSGSDLIGGLAPDGVSGRVVNLDGDVQWTSAWRPRAFTPDGRYVAAVLTDQDGNGTDLAILDGRTGDVVTQVSLHDRGLVQSGSPVWEDSDSAVLLQVEDARGDAVLRLTAPGGLTLASDVEPKADLPMWFFATTP